MKVDRLREYEDEIQIDIGRVHIRVIKENDDTDVYIYDNLKDEDNDYVDEDFKTSWTFEEEEE
jgi:hypothetical protein